MQRPSYSHHPNFLFMTREEIKKGSSHSFNQQGRKGRQTQEDKVSGNLGFLRNAGISEPATAISQDFAPKGNCSTRSSRETAVTWSWQPSLQIRSQANQLVKFIGLASKDIQKPHGVIRTWKGSVHPFRVEGASVCKMQRELLQNGTKTKKQNPNQTLVLVRTSVIKTFSLCFHW